MRLACALLRNAGRVYKTQKNNPYISPLDKKYFIIKNIFNKMFFFRRKPAFIKKYFLHVAKKIF